MAEIGAGAYGILLTTFDEDDRILHRDLVAQAEFVATTAQGVVWPVMASEFYVLSVEEIEAGFPAVAEGAAGRAPFVAGVSQLTTADAVRLTRAAARAGADAVIAMPPYIKKAVGPDLLAYYRAIAEVGLPIVVQNHSGMGTAGPISAAELRELADTIPEVQYLKEEAPVLPQTITRALDTLPGAYRQIWGGGGGRFLIDELHRGGSGTMAASEWVDLLGAVYRAWERHDEQEARRLHDAALAGIVLEMAYGMPGAKQVLHKRGITRSVRSRLGAESVIDEAGHREIDATLTRLAEVLPWKASETDSPYAGR